MGTTADKLTYLNTTKGKIKDSINNLGGELTTNSTFRSYASELDSIYSRLPKVSGTGSEISLVPTLKGRLGSVLKGDTYQQTYSGKNLFHNTLELQERTTSSGVTIKPNNDGSITLNGTATSNQYINLDTYDYNVGIGTLTDVSTTRKSVSNNNYTLSCYIDNGTLNSVGYNNSNKYTYIQIKNGETYNNSKVYLQIELSSSMTNYEPYVGKQASPNPDYPQDIQCVEGIQNVELEGKNSFNIDGDFTFGGYSNSTTKNSDNTITTTSNFSYSRGNGQNLSLLKPNTNYTLSAKLISHTSIADNVAVVQICNGVRGNLSIINTLYYQEDGMQTLTFMTPNDTTNLWISFNSVGSSNSATFGIIQIEEGSTATSYVPYKDPQNYEVNLGNIKLYNGDYITGTPDNWSIVRNWNESTITLKGTYYDSDATHRYWWFSKPKDSIDYNNYKSNIIAEVGNASGGGNTLNYAVVANPNDYTLEQLSEKCDGTNYIYKLATPTTTPITDTTLISQLNALYNAKSYDGQTNISVSGNLPMILEVGALKGEV